MRQSTLQSGYFQILKNNQNKQSLYLINILGLMIIAMYRSRTQSRGVLSPSLSHKKQHRRSLAPLTCVNKARFPYPSLHHQTANTAMHPLHCPKTTYTHCNLKKKESNRFSIETMSYDLDFSLWLDWSCHHAYIRSQGYIFSNPSPPPPLLTRKGSFILLHLFHFNNMKKKIL